MFSCFLVTVTKEMPSQEDLAWLVDLGFNYGKYPGLGNLLIANKRITIAIAGYAGKDVDAFFKFTLPIFELRIRTSADLAGFGVIAGVAGKATNYVFMGLAQIVRFINYDTIQILAELAKMAGPNNIGYIFCNGFPAVQHILSARNLRAAGLNFVRLAKAAGPDAGNVFVLSLPRVKHLIVSINDIIPVGYALIAAWKQGIRERNLEIFVRGFLATKATSYEALRKAA